MTQDAEQRRDQDHVVTVLQMTDLYRQVVPVLVGLGAVVLLHPCQLPGLHLLGVVGLKVVEEPRQLRVGGLPLVGCDLLQLECTYVICEPCQMVTTSAERTYLNRLPHEAVAGLVGAGEV